MWNYIQNINIWLYNTGTNIKEFFIKYRYVLIVSFIVGILINSVDIFTFKFYLDNERIPYVNHFYDQRYGSLILYKLFPFLVYPVISHIFGIISLIIASLFMIFRHNISNTGKVFFIILFISSIYFSSLQTFYFQSAYNFVGVMLVVFAFRLIENNKNIFLYILAVLFLFIGISSYQANLAIFLSTMMVNVVLNYIADREIKKSINIIFKGVIVLLVSLVIYYIVIKALHDIMQSYYTNMLMWVMDSADYTKIIINIIKFIFMNIWFYLYTAVILLYTFFNFKETKERLFFIVLSILFILSVYSLNILMGNSMPERARIGLAVLPAFIFLLVYIFKSSNILKIIAIILAILTISQNVTHNVKKQYACKLGYEQDLITASKIFDIIYTKYPQVNSDNKYKITFYGKLKYNHIDLTAARNFSFFSVAPIRAYNFLRLMGLPDNIKYNDIFGYYRISIDNIADDLKLLIKNMPSYPNSNCIELYKDTIIVKLSD